MLVFLIDGNILFEATKLTPNTAEFEIPGTGESVKKTKSSKNRVSFLLCRNSLLKERNTEFWNDVEGKRLCPRMIWNFRGVAIPNTTYLYYLHIQNINTKNTKNKYCTSFELNKSPAHRSIRSPRREVVTSSNSKPLSLWEVPPAVVHLKLRQPCLLQESLSLLLPMYASLASSRICADSWLHRVASGVSMLQQPFFSTLTWNRYGTPLS